MKILVVGVNNFGQKHLSGIKDMEISIVERKNDVIKMLSMAGKISIERDMDNNKFIIASKSFLKEKNTFHDSHEN